MYPYRVKVHIFWEGHKILQNLHCRFDRYYIGQIYGEDFAKFCGLLIIYELYLYCRKCINSTFITNFKSVGYSTVYRKKSLKLASLKKNKKMHWEKTQKTLLVLSYHFYSLHELSFCNIHRYIHKRVICMKLKYILNSNTKLSKYVR